MVHFNFHLEAAQLPITLLNVMLKHVTLLVEYKGCCVLYIRVVLALKRLKVVRDPLFLLSVLRAIHFLDAPSRDMKIGHDVIG